MKSFVNEKIDWYFTRWRPTIFPEYSYIRYQFISSELFTKYVMEEGGEEPVVLTQREGAEAGLVEVPGDVDDRGDRPRQVHRNRVD